MEPRASWDTVIPKNKNNSNWSSILPSITSKSKMLLLAKDIRLLWVKKEKCILGDLVVKIPIYWWNCLSTLSGQQDMEKIFLLLSLNQQKLKLYRVIMSNVFLRVVTSVLFWQTRKMCLTGEMESMQLLVMAITKITNSQSKMSILNIF